MVLGDDKTANFSNIYDSPYHHYDNSEVTQLFAGVSRVSLLAKNPFMTPAFLIDRSLPADITSECQIQGNEWPSNACNANDSTFPHLKSFTSF
ncbi:hypothetical protein J6590_063049 [Homalodisca vitripennis]|nr:hypothetical protein J6590_063049 [Homalodisca vitripennis]